MKTPAEMTLLVVDDEASLRGAIAFDFERRGYHVLLAASGNEAKALLAHTTVDAIISDVQMPDGDGIELLRWVREQNHCIPVFIFITGYSSLSVEQAYALGADSLFVKPFDRKILSETVVRLTESASERWKKKNLEESVQGVPLTLDLQHSQLKQEGLQSGFSSHLGRGGLFVEIETSLPKVDTRVNFILQLPSGKDPGATSIEGLGIIRWVRSEPTQVQRAGFGLEFLSLSEDCRGAVVEWIRDQNPKAFIPTF